MNTETKLSDFKVLIPSPDGDEITETITIQVPVTICPHTGEELLTEEAFEQIETTKARYMGLLSPAQIKMIRKRHELSQREMSELLQAGGKSYTRWETGSARPSRVINLLLRAIDEGKVTVEWLRSQRRHEFSWSSVVRHDFQQYRTQQPAVHFTVWTKAPKTALDTEPTYETVPAAA